MKKSRYTILCCVVVAVTYVAPAQSKPSATEQARQHNAEGKKHFSVGDFEKAAEAYMKAYRAKPIPAFLFNLGQCHKRLGGLKHLRRAKFYFRSYLNNAPTAPNRKEVEEDIAALELEIKKLSASQPPALDRPADKPALDKAAVTNKPAASQTSRPDLLPKPHRSEASTTASSAPIYKRWWFWTIVGAAVVGATTATVVALQPDARSPINGTMPPGEVTLQ